MRVSKNIAAIGVQRHYLCNFNFTIEHVNYQIILLLILAVVVLVFNRWMFEMKRKHRRDYYRDEYLKSDAWKRKRYVVLKRDNWHNGMKWIFDLIQKF